jgi:hypothetical protein
MIGDYHVRFCEGLGGEIPPVYSAKRGFEIWVFVASFLAALFVAM